MEDARAAIECLAEQTIKKVSSDPNSTYFEPQENADESQWHLEAGAIDQLADLAAQLQDALLETVAAYHGPMDDSLEAKMAATAQRAETNLNAADVDTAVAFSQSVTGRSTSRGLGE